MSNYVLAMTHEQVALNACIVGRGIKQIDDLFDEKKYQDDVFDSFVMRRLSYLWGAMDSQLTSFASPQFRADAPTADNTELALLDHEYLEFVKKLSKLRDAWFEGFNDDEAGSLFVSRSFVPLYEEFKQDWTMVFIPSLPESAQPDGNETSKP